MCGLAGLDWVSVRMYVHTSNQGRADTWALLNYRTFDRTEL